MQVHTKAYGKIEVDERQRIDFPYGILGFENFHNFILLDAQQQPFYWLQSLDVAEIAFVLIEPTIFRPDYTPDVPQEELHDIDIEKKEDMLVLTIVTIPENYQDMTANLQGPILINREKRIGRQSISQNQNWKIRHKILDELARERNEVC